MVREMTILRLSQTIATCGALLATAPLAQAALANTVGAAALQTINIANPEDLAPLDDHRMIVSSLAGGGHAAGALVLLDTRTGKVDLLPTIAADPGTAPHDGCDEGPVADSALKPHGIAIWNNPRGGRYLYVVNHGQRESVEIYRLILGSRPRLVWQTCAVFPKGGFGNAVAVKRDGSFYTTNEGTQLDGSPPLTMFGGEVISWRNGHGWTAVAGSRVEGANGLLLSPDEKTLFIAGWPAAKVVAVTMNDPEPTVRSLTLPFLPDNLRWGAGGKIYATGHRTSVETVADCFLSPRPTCSISSSMAQIDPASVTMDCVRDVPIDMATSTVAMRGRLWVGSARATHLAAMAGPACPNR